MALICLVSPYNTGSHAAWAEGYRCNSQHTVMPITMAGRFWKWRMQGGALELARQLREVCQTCGKPDLLWVTDMTNLPALLALSAPELSNVPTVFFAHENQLTYPMPEGEKRDFTYAMINVLSMVCATAISFNSQYHHDEFFDELPRLLKHFPDYNHLELISDLKRKSQILPVGIDFGALGLSKPDIQMMSEQNKISVQRTIPGQPASSTRDKQPLRILWNQRWEYDKNPAEFFAALYELQAESLPFQVLIAGENFRQQPDEFSIAKNKLQAHIIHYGYAASRSDYGELLRQADVVVSTAHHEFFGISVLEAVFCGCYPLLPNRLSYPEIIPVEHHAQHLYQSFDDLCDRLKWAAKHPEQVRQCQLSYIAERYDWQYQAVIYDQLSQTIIDRL